MKKKLLTATLAFLLLFTFVACGTDEKKSKPTEKPASEATEEAKDDQKDKEEPADDKKEDTEDTKEETKEDEKEEPADDKSASGDVIKIGVFEPFTGASASGGELTFQGIELAHEEKPEVLGRKVELVVVDNKSDQVEASNAAQRLVDKDKVNAVVGSYSSSLSIAGGGVFMDAKIPAVGCSPTNPQVTKNNPYYFRVCFIDPFQGTVMAKFASENLGAKTAAVVKDIAQDYSVGLVKYFVDAFTEINGADAIVAEASYRSGDQDFTSQLNNIKQAEPDVIFCPGNYGECALMIKQARDLGIEVPMLGGDTWESPDFIKIGGENINKEVYFSSHFTYEKPLNDVSEAYLDKYKAKFNENSNAFAALGYDAYMVIIDAIERAGSAEPEAIRDALAETKDFIGATGVITLDEEGDAVKSAIVNQVKDDGFVYLTTIEPNSSK
ncbi:MAG: ABC transporter substrate-binding protein [Eubacteriales bacterium]|nr:ABC transporter substrate-binding protein [Eubacteriales bacterium]